jgi:hypothetical protein
MKKTVRIVPMAGRIDLPRYPETAASINAAGTAVCGLKKSMKSNAARPHKMPSLNLSGFCFGLSSRLLDSPVMVITGLWIEGFVLI